MADCGSAVVKSDGFACLLSRFETRVDSGGVFSRLPEKAYLAGSIRGGQRDVHKIIDLPALEPIDRSNQFVPTPNGNKSIVKSSSESTESHVLSSPTAAGVNLSKLASAGKMRVNDEGVAGLQHAATGYENAKNSMDEREPEKSLASSSLSTQTNSSSSSSSDHLKDSITTSKTSEANLPMAIKNRDQVQLEDGSAVLTTASDPGKVTTSSFNCSGSMNELDTAERKLAAKGRREAGGAVATRFIFKQSSRENQNATVYLDDTSSSSSSPSTSNKVKQLARSMDNLCSNNSGASSPTKSTTRAGKWSDNSSLPSTAPAAIQSPTNDDEKQAAVRARKPPPVPKKNPKFSREAELPQAGESQTMPNLSQAKKPATRPTTLFPDHQVADGGGGDENDDDDDSRHKSLPILGSAKDDGQYEQRQLHPTANDPKNTLFPCNRQKNRTRILSPTETNSTGDQGLPYSPFVTSPTSLGTRTPPDIDSPVENKPSFADKKYSAEQQSTTIGSVFARSRSSDQLLSVEAAATDDVFDSHEAFDPDSFLSDAFDFLDSSNSAESETKTSSSPLKSWTDTWCKASQKRLSRVPDKSAAVAGSSKEHRPTDGYRKEPEGSLPDKTKPQDEKTAKTKSTNRFNVGPNKTSNVPVKSFGRDEKTKTGEDAEPPTHFGVVLRRTDAPSSLFRRSSVASLVSKEIPSAPRKANARHESFVSRPVTLRKSTESFRTSDRTSANLNRKPSMVAAGTSSALPPTAAVPSQKPTHKSLFGRNIVGGRASSTLGDSSAAEVHVGARGSRQSTSANKLESELNDIDRAFMFLGSP